MRKINKIIQKTNLRMNQLSILRNRKAQSPEVFIVIAAVLVLIVGLIVLGNLKGRLPTEVSKANVELISHYSKGENILFYLDESARLASNNVIDEIYSYSLNSGCGTIDGLMLWKNQSELCTPNNKDIVNLFITKFIPEFNNILDNFNLYSTKYNVTIPSFEPGDIYLDKEENKLVGYPFKNMIIGDNPKYEFGIRFSQDLPISMFNHGAGEVITKINTRCSQKEDLSIEQKYGFTECVNQVLNEINKEKRQNNNNNINYNSKTEELIWQSGESCGDDLFNFVQEYNNCARSNDNFCECQMRENYSDYKIENNKQTSIGITTQVTYNNQSYDLELPFDTETKQILPLYKSDNMLHLDDVGNSIPLCRSNDRYVNLCLIEGKHKLHFQAYVDDKAKPQSITLTETKLDDGRTNYTWQPSLSGDVKEYLVFVAKSDLPFPTLESSPTSTIGREVRYTQNLSYVVDSGFKAKIVPIDYSGNVGG